MGRWWIVPVSSSVVFSAAAGGSFNNAHGNVNKTEITFTAVGERYDVSRGWQGSEHDATSEVDTTRSGRSLRGMTAANKTKTTSSTQSDLLDSSADDVTSMSVPHRVDGIFYCEDKCAAGEDASLVCTHPAWSIGNCRDCGREVSRCLEEEQKPDGCEWASSRVWCKCMNGCKVWGGGKFSSGDHCYENYPRLCRVGTNLCRVGGRAVPGANSSTGCAINPDGRNFTRQICDVEQKLQGSLCDALKCSTWCARKMIGCEIEFKESCLIQKAGLDEPCDVDCNPSAPLPVVSVAVIFLTAAALLPALRT